MRSLSCICMRRAGGGRCGGGERGGMRRGAGGRAGGGRGGQFPPGRAAPPPVRPGQPGHRYRRQPDGGRSEEHTSELQSQFHLVCRLLLEKKKFILISEYIIKTTIYL